MGTTSTITIFDGPESRAVMTYNIKNAWDGGHWSSRRDALVDVIRAEQPLLLGIQEAFRSQIADIMDRLPGYDFVGSGRFPDLTDEHCAILYDTDRVQMIDSGTFWLADTPEEPGSIVEGENLPRIATWARCRVTGHEREVLMVNTHLTYQDIGLVTQTANLVQGIDRISGTTLDVMLTGDFNQNRYTPTWQKVISAGFIDALDFAETIEGPISTFPDWEQWNDERAASVTIENRIDWIMYRPGEGHPLPHNVTLRVINTHTAPAPPSDHFPVVLSGKAEPC